MKRSVLPALLIGVGFIVLVACNGGDSAAPTATSLPIRPPPGQTVVAPTPTAVPPFEGSRDPVEVPGGSAPPTPLLVAVRAARQQGFDRVVFDFGDTSGPGYRVEYVTAPIQQCASGNQETVDGSAFIQVRMTPAAAHDDAGQPTFDMTEILLGLPTILEVQQTCDFEGTVTWVLGISEEVDFVVSAFPDPFRIVVDVAHPSN